VAHNLRFNLTSDRNFCGGIIKIDARRYGFAALPEKGFNKTDDSFEAIFRIGFGMIMTDCPLLTSAMSSEKILIRAGSVGIVDTENILSFLEIHSLF
jgi:hypothetical protein